MLAVILSGIYAGVGVLVYRWMITGGVTVGTSTDFLVRRVLFPFVFMLVGGVLNYFSTPYSRISAWFRKKPWRYGISCMLVIELYGLYMIMTEPGTADQSSAIFHTWIAEWWIFVLALLLGILGAYAGNGLAKNWRQRSQKNMGVSQAED